MSWRRAVPLAVYTIVGGLASGCGGSGTPPVSGPPPAPTASFAFATVSAADRAVSFADTRTGAPTSWAWAFGDGATSAERHPTHSYAAAGPYAVSLAVGNAGGSSTVTASVTVADRTESEMCDGGTPTIALLVGDVPHAYQTVELHGVRPLREEVISFQ